MSFACSDLVELYVDFVDIVMVKGACKAFPYLYAALILNWPLRDKTLSLSKIKGASSNGCQSGYAVF